VFPPVSKSWRALLQTAAGSSRHASGPSSLMLASTCLHPCVSPAAGMQSDAAHCSRSQRRPSPSPLAPRAELLLAVASLLAACCLLRRGAVAAASVSLVEMQDLVVREAWCWGGQGKSCSFVVCTPFVSFFSFFYFLNSDQCNIC